MQPSLRRWKGQRATKVGYASGLECSERRLRLLR